MTPVLGIVAEYNPLHRGHLRMMGAARDAMGGPCVVALSSNFTQRGAPALMDKWARTGTALAAGADLVLEIPFLHACAAAPDFAAAGVDLLACVGVTHLVFGMEDPEEAMAPLADLFLSEPPEFRARLRELLSSGTSWARARCEAAESLLPGSAAFLSKPNNLLALHYLLRVRRKGYPLTPVPLPRGPERAESVRAALDAGDGAAVSAAVPDFTLAALETERGAGRLCGTRETEGLWPLIQGLLLRSEPEDLSRFDGMDEGIEGLLLNRWRRARGFEDLVGLCATSRYPKSRVRRALIRLLTGVGREDGALARAGVPYARVLGFTDRGRELLRDRRGMPLVTRLAAVQGPGRSCAALEFRATALRDLLLGGLRPSGQGELRSPVRAEIRP